MTMSQEEIDRIAEQISYEASHNEKEFWRLLNESEPVVIATALSKFHGGAQSYWDAKREAAFAILASKLSNDLTSTITKLDHSATKLARIGIILTVVIGVLSIVVGIAQIVVPLWLQHHPR